MPETRVVPGTRADSETSGTWRARELGRDMKFRQFEQAARGAFAEIPEEYTNGLDGLSIRREALPHPVFADIYTLGMCSTESYPSDWQGPETTRSVVALYYGSFRELSRLDPGFDWEGELWETLTHELRHHLESLADRDELGGVDYAMEESFKRSEGLDFDPCYYQSGDEVAQGVFRVETDFFIEQQWTAERLARAGEVRFQWRGADYRIEAPGRLGDAHFVWIDGVDVGPGELQVVLVRRRRWWEAFLKRPPGELWESEAVAHGMGGADIAREKDGARRAEGARERGAIRARPESDAAGEAR